MLLRNFAAESTNSKPYQGVRVKDPVKELLRRKRGSNNPNSVKTSTPTTVVVPNSILPSYTPIGTSGLLEGSPCNVGEVSMDAGALYSGWLTQPTAAPLQPIGHWAPATDYLQTDSAPVPVSASSFTSDVYVQPVCPSYTVVAPSSLLTLTHTPLFTNIGAIAPTQATLPPADFTDASLAYIPWTQTLATLPGPIMQYPSCPAAMSAGPVFPVTTLPSAVPVSSVPSMTTVPSVLPISSVPPMTSVPSPVSISPVPPITTVPSAVPISQVPPMTSVAPISPVPTERITVPLPESEPQEMEEPNPLEKLLEDNPKDSDYVCSPSLFDQDV